MIKVIISLLNFLGIRYYHCAQFSLRQFSIILATNSDGCITSSSSNLCWILSYHQRLQITVITDLFQRCMMYFITKKSYSSYALFMHMHISY